MQAFAKITAYLKRCTYHVHSFFRDMVGGIRTCTMLRLPHWYIFRRSYTDF